jgi:hypothetical protein
MGGGQKIRTPYQLGSPARPLRAHALFLNGLLTLFEHPVGSVE